MRKSNGLPSSQLVVMKLRGWWLVVLAGDVGGVGEVMAEGDGSFINGHELDVVAVGMILGLVFASSGLAHVTQALGVGSKTVDLASQVGGIAGFKEQASSARLDHLGGGAEVGGDDGRAFGEGLGDGPAEGFVAGGGE